VIITHGDQADRFYVLLKGVCSVWERDDAGREVRVNSLQAGQSFGELGLLKSAPRTATVRAETDLDLMSINREEFLTWIYDADLTPDEIGDALWHEYIGALLAVALPGLSSEMTQQLAVAALRRSFEPGQDIVRRGDPADACYVIHAGRVDVLQEGDAEETLITSLGPGMAFGELGVFHRRPRIATVRASGDSPSDVFEIPGQRLLDVLNQSSDMKAEVAMKMSRQLYEIIDTLASTSEDNPSLDMSMI